MSSESSIAEPNSQPSNKWNYLRINLREYLRKHNSCIKIQACWRGWKVRKNNKRALDKYSIPLINEDLDEHIRHDKYIEKRNRSFGNSHKKWRRDNFPSHISENICKFAFIKKYGLYPSWNTNKGDLQLFIPRLQIEVKGFMSDGPTSFGPTENWDFIYFVDCKNFVSKKFKVYEVRLSNKCETWRKIIISGKYFNIEDIPVLPDNMSVLKRDELKELCKKRGLVNSGHKKELIERLQTQKPGARFNKPKTYGEICNENKRGELRSSFYNTFKPQLGEHCKLIFDGHISELNTSL